MKAVLPALVSILALAACVPASKAPPVAAPAPVVRPAPARPAPVLAPVMQPPVQTSWMDAPATPGDWEFAAFPFGSQAIFRGPAGADTGFALSCNFADRQITLLRPVASQQPRTMRILTETASRVATAQPAQSAGVMIRLNPGDPLLDAIALSKGRFAVESEGLPTLYLPSWAEISRVIEDCR